MTPTTLSQRVYAPDKLAGLIFMTDHDWCYFRATCGFAFNYPLHESGAYALIDPETDECIGIRRPGHFMGTTEPPLFRVFLLRPLLDDANVS